MLHLTSVAALGVAGIFAVAFFLSQNVSAGERHRVHPVRYQKSGTQYRGAYAAAPYGYDVNGVVLPDVSRYEGGAISAPAGR
jgi:hypothetical protein